MKKTTKKWLEKTAKANGVTESEVLRYLRNLRWRGWRASS